MFHVRNPRYGPLSGFAGRAVASESVTFALGADDTRADTIR
jgi:hypothetical protein